MNTGKVIRWGVLGCGGIARKFIASAKQVDAAKIVAVASASGNRAKEFATENGAEKGYGSYAELLADESIEAVYVANTHNFHYKTVLQVLNAGKHVLCEKPMAVSAKETKEMIDLARAKGLFLMEAMWTRFLPAVVQLRKWIEEGRIGKPRRIDAHLNFVANFEPEHRMVNPDLAGGAVLDLGIYPLSFASMIAKGAVPQKIASTVAFGETGVDMDDLIQLSYENGLGAQLSCGMEVPTENFAEVVGEKGSIKLHELFISATTVTLKTENEEQTLTWPCPDLEGFKYEIEATCECLLKGEKECSVMPLDETLLLAETMDTIRADCGLKYPFE